MFVPDLEAWFLWLKRKFFQIQSFRLLLVPLLLLPPWDYVGIWMQEYRKVERKRENCSLCILRDPFLFFDSPLGVPVGTSAQVSIESFAGLRQGDAGGNKVILTAISGIVWIFVFSPKGLFVFPMLFHAFCLGFIDAFNERDRMPLVYLHQNIVIISHCFRSSGKCNKRHDTEMRCKAWKGVKWLLFANFNSQHSLTSHCVSNMICSNLYTHDLMWSSNKLIAGHYCYHLHFTDRETKAKSNHLSCSRSCSPLVEKPLWYLQ